MKNSYNRSKSASQWAKAWVFLLALFSLPSLGWGQTFTETMGTTAGSRQTVASYYAANGFSNDNEKGFVYSGSAVTATAASSTGYTGASGSISIFFGPATSAQDPGTPPYNFQIANINTTGISGYRGLTFGLFAPSGSSISTLNTQFKVAYSTDGVAYTDVAYTALTTNTNSNASVNNGFAWNQYTLSSEVPSAANLRLRFTRQSGTSLYRLDDVALASMTPTLTVSPGAVAFADDVTVGSTSTETQTFTFTGQNLTADVALTLGSTANFVISKTGANGTFISGPLSYTIAEATGTHTVYVKFAPTVIGDPLTTNITASGGGVTSAASTRRVTVSGTSVPAPPTVDIVQTSLAFSNTQVGSASTPQSLTVTGANLTGTVVVSSGSDDFELLNPATGTYTTSDIVLNSGGASSLNTTVQVRFAPKNNVVAPELRSSIVSVSTAGSDDTDEAAVSGTATPQPPGPNVYANPSTIAFGDVSGTGSAEPDESFVVGGSNLTAPIVLTRSNSAIQFRVAGSGAYTNNASITLTPVNGTVPATTIQVRLRTVPNGPFTGNITASSTGAPNAVVQITANNPFTGTNTNTSVQALTTNSQGVPFLPIFSTVLGRPSRSASYKITGENLVRPITVTAPANFQISKDSLFTGISSSTSANGNTLTYAPVNGYIAATRVYVRYNPTEQAQHSENTSNFSSPATEVLASVRGNSEPTITISGDFTFETKVVINQFSAAKTYQLFAERVLAPITISVQPDASDSYNASQTPQFQISLDGITYFTSLVVTPNQVTASVDRPLYVRYAPTRVGNPLSKLRYKSSDTGPTTINFVNTANPVQSSLSGFGLALEPTLRTQFVASRTSDGASASVNFFFPAGVTDPEAAGYGKLRMVVVSENPTLLAPGQNPSDGTDYSPGTLGYKSGSKLPPNPTPAPGVTDPNFYVVYASTTGSATFNGLDPAKDYYIFVFDYNSNNPGVNTIQGGAANFLVPSEQETIQGILIESPLPVTLTAFSAKAANKQVNLSWTTATEVNNKGFEVQRSADGKTFLTIDFVAGNGSSTNKHEYKSTDKNPLSGTSYYRLKQVDLDGQFAYSEVKTVVNGAAGALSVYPNPVQNNVTITLPITAQNARVQVLDLAGRVVLTRTLSADGNLQLSELQRGTYLVRVEQGNQAWTQKIVKQ
ncbi:T9SS type A sorting domain-containing protein [Hymenobacter guriensis]|uniref:T9SS type A sorting domain-containing protein n=1 Tax=Hymenobacter guriensis TaxID=2793065 RepID=A0ABS0KVR5_9BACT|nr:T9SS type A sorting domain-containing protein [Hymenobacter guriensis]MBG8551963.1 T9SS type A sorting domain-containing protein [Hymenobacter guriensis]